MAEALVLNATYEPLCVVPGRRAVVLVLADKAVEVAASGDILHSTEHQAQGTMRTQHPRTKHPAGALIHLLGTAGQEVQHRHPYRHTIGDLLENHRKRTVGNL